MCVCMCIKSEIVDVWLCLYYKCMVTEYRDFNARQVSFSLLPLLPFIFLRRRIYFITVYYILCFFYEYFFLKIYYSLLLLCLHSVYTMYIMLYSGESVMYYNNK